MNRQNLKDVGLKITVPRVRILDILDKTATRHMTAERLYQQLQDAGQPVSLATVYRVLTQFEQAGLLKRSNFESGRSVFELEKGSHHDHLVCVDCGRVEEFFDAEIERRQKIIAAERGFELQDHALSLYGTCIKEDCEFRPEKRKRET